MIQKYKTAIIIACSLTLLVFLWLTYEALIKNSKITGEKTKIDAEKIYENETPAENGLMQVNDKNLPIIPLHINVRDSSTGINLKQILTITFNRPVLSGDFEISTDPEIEANISQQGKKVTIEPVLPLKPKTEYKIAVSTSTGENKVFTFQTMDPENPASVNTYNPGLKEESEKISLAQNPSLFLKNKTPYESNNFQISGYYDKKIKNFAFVIKYKTSKEQASKEATNWMISLGMVNEDIKTLKIDFTPWSENDKKLKNLRQALPYQGENLRIDPAPDTFIITIFGNTKKGMTELDKFLKKNGIEDKSILGEIEIDVVE